VFLFQNGFTALTRAIVYNQFEVAKQLCITRPALRKIGDNVSEINHRNT